MGERGPDPEYTLNDVLTIFNQRQDSCEPLTAQEVAEMLDCSRPKAYELLKQLAEENAIVSKKVGARAKVWWIPEDHETK